MATTTLEAVRDNAIGILQALTPPSLQAIPFRVSRGERPIRDWALANPQACTRVFSITRAGGELIESADYQQELVSVPLEITVCYEASFGRYGSDNSRDIEDLIDADWGKLNGRSGIGLYNRSGYVDGCLDVQLSGRVIEREGRVYFLRAEMRPRFLRSPQAAISLATPLPTLDTVADWSAALLYNYDPSHLYTFQAAASPVPDEIGGSGGELVTVGTLDYGYPSPTLAGWTGVRCPAGATNRLRCATPGYWGFAAGESGLIVRVWEALDPITTGFIVSLHGSNPNQPWWREGIFGSAERLDFQVQESTLVGTAVDFGGGTSLPAAVYVEALRVLRTNTTVEQFAWRSSDGASVSASKDISALPTGALDGAGFSEIGWISGTPSQPLLLLRQIMFRGAAAEGDFGLPNVENVPVAIGLAA